MGQYVEAETLYLQTQKILSSTVGDTHPDYAIGLSNLAFLYSRIGDYAKAEPLYREALEIRKKSLGPDHPSYASTLHNLALLYYSMKEYAKAEPLCLQVLEIRKVALGEDHPDYASTLLALADVHSETRIRGGRAIVRSGEWNPRRAQWARTILTTRRLSTAWP